MRIFRKPKPDDSRNDIDKQYARVDTGSSDGSLVTHRWSLLWYNVQCTDRINEVGPRINRSDKYDSRKRILIPALGANIP